MVSDVIWMATLICYHLRTTIYTEQITNIMFCCNYPPKICYALYQG